MVSSRFVCRLSALALIVLTGLLLLAGGSCATAEPTRTAALALDGPEESWAPQQKLLCNDTLPYSYFGWSAAIDVDQAIVGAYRADHDRGAAYVYIWTGKKWVQQAKLTSIDGAQGDFLGGSVALAGDTAVVGAPYKGTFGAPAAGAAYVFDRSEGQWAQAAKLTAKEAGPGSSFGWSTAFTVDTIVVGSSPNDFNGQITPVPLEAVYVFGRSGSAWTEVAKLNASDAKAGQFFGTSVAMEGDTLVVGAPGDSEKASGSGAVYVFARSGGAWSQIAKLKANDAKVNDAMGWATAISGGTVVTGAPHSNAPKLSSGAAYVFTQGPGGFTQQAKLAPQDPTANYRVGGSVAIDGDIVLLGRQFYYNQDQDHGAAYVFARSDDVWTETAKFTRDTDPVGIWFGNSVAVRGTTAFVGSVEYDVAGIDDPGATFVFALRRVNSVSCSDGAECVSGFCADGVCCDAACEGPCLACSAEKKGGGDDGVCEPVADSTDPHGDCKPYACSGGACLSSCQSTADCAKTFYCESARRECATVSQDIGATAGCSVSPGLHGGGSLGLVAGLFAAVFWARRRPRRRSLGLSALFVGLVPLACGSFPGVDERGPGPARHPAEAPPTPGSLGIQIEEQTEFFAGGPAKGDEFGKSLALSGDTAIIGAPLRDTSGMSDGGAAYVFTRAGDLWTQEAMLVAKDPAVNARFGGPVALSGDTAVVSAPTLNAAYVFARSSGAWAQQAKLTPGAAFTGAIAVSGDTLALGAPGDNALGGNAGAALVFLRTGAAWKQEIKLLAGDGAEDDRFGAAVAADGDTVVVGARHADEQDTDAGAAYVFVRADGGWTQQAKLLASDGVVNDNLGGVIALSGDRVVLGVPVAMSTGAAYVFARDAAGVWTEEAKLLASDGAAGDAFGASVTIDGDTVVVGAPGSDVRGADAGAAYVYMRVSGAWREVAEVTAEDAQAGDSYGAAAAASGTTAIVGAPRNDFAFAGTDVGAAYALLLGAPAGCIDETHSAAERLPGEPLAVTDCAPRRCDLATGTCPASCKETAECIKGFFCDPAKKACARAPAKDIGAQGGCRAAAGEAQSGALPLLLAGLSVGRWLVRRRRRR